MSIYGVNFAPVSILLWYARKACLFKIMCRIYWFLDVIYGLNKKKWITWYEVFKTVLLFYHYYFSVDIHQLVRILSSWIFLLLLKSLAFHQDYIFKNISLKKEESKIKNKSSLFKIVMLNKFILLEKLGERYYNPNKQLPLSFCQTILLTPIKNNRRL